MYRLLVKAATSGAGVDDDEWQVIRDRYQESTHLLNLWQGLSESLRQELAGRSIDLEALRRENEQLTRSLRHAEALVQERETYAQELDKALQEAQLLVRERNARVEELDTALQEATRYVRKYEASIMTLTAELEQLKQGRTKAR